MSIDELINQLMDLYETSLDCKAKIERYHFENLMTRAYELGRHDKEAQIWEERNRRAKRLGRKIEMRGD